MKLSDFDFKVPKRLIAQHPLPDRGQSRLLVVRRKEQRWEHRWFRDLPEILSPDDFLVLNNTRVFPARLWARRDGKNERIEVLLVREIAAGRWMALVKPARKAAVGTCLKIGDLGARVVDATGGSGWRVLEFEGEPDLIAVAEEIGEVPLPHYIRRPGGATPRDRESYQTVYAACTGSIAAPTAGLHFTPALLEHLRSRGIATCEVLLHVGYGTFQPIRTEEVEGHRMLPEYFEIAGDTAARIGSLKASGHRLVAVGTTTTRVLEYVARGGGFPPSEMSGMCDLFIYPGFEFRILGGLITNFHLPKSSPFLLACAFAGRELMLECYRDACERGYRFFSYGDAMLLF